LKQKKILTQLKSKYYMLKVHYPKLAEQIDNEPINLEPIETDQSILGNQEAGQKANNIKHTPMSEMVAPIDFKEDTDEAKQAQIANDRLHSEALGVVTDELIKGLEEIKKVDQFYA